jgi:hypothetical protein
MSTLLTNPTQPDVSQPDVSQPEATKEISTEILKQDVESTKTPVEPKEPNHVKIDNIQQSITSIYKVIKENGQAMIQLFKEDKTPDALFITLLTGQIIKQVEQSSFKGVDKKTITIEVIKTIVKEEIKDETKERSLLLLIDLVADPLIDQIVDVSKHINKSTPTTSKQNVAEPKQCCSIM